MKKFVTIGCSVTCGAGLYEDPRRSGKDHPDLWVNLLHKDLFSDMKLHNPSIHGSGHLEAFELASREMLLQDPEHPTDTVIVFWTSVPRYVLTVGCELYDTTIFFSSKKQRTIHTNDIVFPASFLERVSNEFFALHHPHNDIVKIINYANLLIEIARRTNVKLYFFTGGNWDDNYLKRDTRPNLRPSDLTPYTQKILNVHNRDDEEVFKLYHKIHDDYDRVGGVNQAHWINAFDPENIKHDVGYDGIHGGPKSHRIYYEKIKNFFLTKKTLFDRG